MVRQRERQDGGYGVGGGGIYRAPSNIRLLLGFSHSIKFCSAKHELFSQRLHFLKAGRDILLVRAYMCVCVSSVISDSLQPHGL